MENFQEGPSELGIEFSVRTPEQNRATVYSCLDVGCPMCGLENGEIDWTTGLRAKLQVDWPAEFSAPLVICSVCSSGRRGWKTRRCSQSLILRRVQGAEEAEQLVVLKWLERSSYV